MIRAETSEEGEKIAKACMNGGIDIIEITFTVPGTHKVIENLKKIFGKEELILGAGTVLDPETARVAILSGAEYIVSPAFNLETAKLCNIYQIPCMPGCTTLKRLLQLWKPGQI